MNSRLWMGVVCGILIGGVASAASGPHDERERLKTFIAAGMAYRDGDYDRAVALYERIRNGGWESGPLDYNIGNAYFKQGRLGKAILAYERARRIMPRDTDLRANLRFARSRIPWDFSGRSGPLFRRALAFWLDRISVDGWAWLTLGIFWLAACTHLAASFFERGRFLRRDLPLVLVVAGVLSFWGVAAGASFWERRAVAVSGAECRFEPREAGTVYFHLPEGAVVEVLRSRAGWTKVRRPDGKTGWLSEGKIESIVL